MLAGLHRPSDRRPQHGGGGGWAGVSSRATIERHEKARRKSGTRGANGRLVRSRHHSGRGCSPSVVGFSRWGGISCRAGCSTTCTSGASHKLLSLKTSRKRTEGCTADTPRLIQTLCPRRIDTWRSADPDCIELWRHPARRLQLQLCRECDSEERDPHAADWSDWCPRRLCYAVTKNERFECEGMNESSEVRSWRGGS